MNHSRLSRLTVPNGARRERAFARLMAARGVTLQPNVRVFRFGLSRYRPDFYDPAADIYYEVIGSRQRYHQLLPKFDLMRHCEPAITLRVLRPNGEVILAHKRRWRRDHLAEELNEALASRKLTAGELAGLASVASSELSTAMRQNAEPRHGRLRQRLTEWCRTGVMPPSLSDCQTQTRAATWAAQRARIARIVTTIQSQGFVRAAVARGAGMSPQMLNNTLSGRRNRRSPGLLARLEAWLEGPGRNGAGHEDRRRREYRARVAP